MAYWEVLRETFLDSIITLPILLAVYFLIEFIEFKWAVKLQKNRLLRGKASPVIGALVGSVPQCGFSVVATDLFAQGMIPVGALLAVFIATNDEALPLLLAHPQSWLSVMILIAAKIALAVVVGYAANLLYRCLFRRKVAAANAIPLVEVKAHDETAHHADEQAGTQQSTDHNHDEEEEHEPSLHDGCCHHSMTGKRFDWRHPLWHSLKIWAFIFLVSLLFGCVADIWVGQDRLTEFLTASIWLQPLLAVVVGLIPNCATSVVLTELYLVGGLRFGALLGGLCVNAGLGIIFLLRQKRLWREKLFVISWLLVTSLAVGYAFLWLAI